MENDARPRKMITFTNGPKSAFWSVYQQLGRKIAQFWSDSHAIFSPFFSYAHLLFHLYKSRKEYCCSPCITTFFYLSRIPGISKILYKTVQISQNSLFYFQTSIMSLSGQKSDLFHINVEIHNFLAELSCCPGVVFNTPPSSLGRKDKQQQSHPRQSQQLMMTPEVANPEILWQQPHRKETPITKGLKDKVVALYSKWDEAFHK